MSVAEMKLAAMNHLIHLEDEKAVQEVLSHLEVLAKQEKFNRANKIESVFNEAAEQYGNTLKKLAE